MRLVRGALYLCLFALGIAGGGYLLIRVSFTGTSTVVPPVVGLTQEQAEWQARRAHLVFVVQSERYDLQQERGRVVTQSPSAGMSTRRGMALQVVVSKGVERVQMPNLTGLRLDEAQIQVRQTGLRLGPAAYAHGTAPMQTVSAQDPPAGSVVPKDSAVSLLISVGPDAPLFVTPYLIGAQRASVESGLQPYGIQLGAVRTANVPGASPGAVLAQTPGPGTPLSRSDMVQLTVNQP